MRSSHCVLRDFQTGVSSGQVGAGAEKRLQSHHIEVVIAVILKDEIAPGRMWTLFGREDAQHKILRNSNLKTGRVKDKISGSQNLHLPPNAALCYVLKWGMRSSLLVFLSGVKNVLQACAASAWSNRRKEGEDLQWAKALEVRSGEAGGTVSGLPAEKEAAVHSAPIPALLPLA